MAARKFNPAAHPRDRFGRFTKSRTVKATPKDKTSAKSVADGFVPKQVSRSERDAYLRKIAGRDTAGQSFADVTETNKALRAGKDTPGVADLEQAMVALPDDVLLSRRVPLTVFGSTDLESLAGMKVRDAGFAPTQFGTVTAGEGQVRMRIAAPAGTRAAVNPTTGEVVLDRDTEMVVARVETNSSGGYDMYLTVLPKVSTKPDVPAADGDGQPEDDDQVRADLMKLKVPELQAQMRERGLKPGRLRKSQLVAALVADETGGDAPVMTEPGPRVTPPTASETPDEQVMNAIHDALQSAGRSPGDYVQLADVRDRVPGMSRTEQDAVLVSLDRARRIHLDPDPGRNQRTQRQLDAGILVADENRSLVVTYERRRPGGNPEAQSLNRPTPAATRGEALSASPVGLYRSNGDLSEFEMDALDRYQNGHAVSYTQINGALRDTANARSEQVAAAIAGIDSAMEKAPLSSDVQTWRGVRDARVMFGSRFDGDLTGMRWREDAYVSTSADREAAAEFSGKRSEPLLMRVYVPAGVRAVDLLDPNDPGEAELLLDRGHDFEIVADRGVVNGVREVDVVAHPKTAVPPADTVADAPASVTTPEPFDDRISTAAENRKALDAAPLSLLPRSRTDPDLTPERADILKAYKRAEVSDVEAALREGGDVSQVTGDRIAALDDAVNASPLSSDVVLYRTAPTARDVFGDSAAGDLTGVEVTESGFVSLTASAQRAQDSTAGGGLLMRILTPAGVGAVALSAGSDQEVLVGRGHTFRVVKDHGRKRGEPRRVDVELIPRTADQPDPFRVVESRETTADNPLGAEQVAALPDSPLGRGLASGVALSKSLDAGDVGDVRLVTFNDGSQAIQKIAQRSFAGSSQKDLTDGEDLAGRLGRAIGAPVPEVVRTGDIEVFMEYVPNARPGMNVLNRYNNLVERAGKFEEFIDSRDGRLLGVLDLIVGNHDRHAGNWLVRKDGTITGIDHGLVWVPRDTNTPDVRATDPTFESPFAGRLFGGRTADVKGWRPNDLTTGDVAWMREQVTALRAEFEALGRGNWLDYSLTRLDQLREYAQGRKDRVRP